ncbi:MAG: acyl-CoA dehydrogenase family protein [Proteobacteria bacterium]|nr:acyl-CoA dehydrogenase family protein [Pseudomonadota bacterium]MCP4919247.1 acyl-CoA dehydrogenase family protein [Pseudomonadota bacterium]
MYQDLTGSSGERARAGGRASDRLGFAFASGYQAAAERMFGAGRKTALCATEAGGNHPRRIQTTLLDGRVTGEKTFVTLGTHADRLAVVARVGERDGRPDLRVVLVEADAPGVTLHALPALPFVPEIPHARVVLDGALGEVLPGDGYLGVLKPFRTVEDIHVHLGLLGLLERYAPSPAVTTLADQLVLLAERPPLDPQVHRQLGESIDRARALLDPPPPVPHFERDRPLLQIAENARRKRREKAQTSS